MKIAWSELIKFLKNNIIKFIIGIIISAIAFAGLSYFFGGNNIEKLRNNIEIEGIDQEAELAYFLFYIEDQENRIFTNNLLVEEYFTLPEILESASKVTNTNLYEIVEETENEAVIEDTLSNMSNVIGVNRDGSSQLLKFYVNIGNESNNLEIANYYYNLITENEVPFLEDKMIYIFEEPQIQIIDEEESLENSTKITEDTYNIIFNIAVGSLFGLFAVTLVLFILTLFSKKLVYSFSYSILEQDHFFLIDNSLETTTDLMGILSLPQNARKVVVWEENSEVNNNEFNKITTELKHTQNLEFVNSILEIERPEEADRVIYIINENATSRKWYNKQRRLGKNLNINTVILQINAD